jgi:hypothetical protein
MMPLDVLVNQIQEKISNIPYFTRLLQMSHEFKTYKLSDYDGLCVRMNMHVARVTLLKNVPDNEIETELKSSELLYELQIVSENARKLS